ncbi:MAG: TetR/AcrR family transcriptional regulator C-terminal domain-containing protein [Micrococcales bacterium]|nr:TetR/AcrR family transcriptional regulator C-terminal domain-containing protein [Micrococcales bacterium]
MNTPTSSSSPPSTSPRPAIAAGFSQELTAHAYALLDAYVYGFAVQESSLPFSGSATVGDVAGPMAERMATGDYAHLVEMTNSYYLQPGYDFGHEFTFGLDLILEALALRLAAQPT